jgi:hypothetical protein
MYFLNAFFTPRTEPGNSKGSKWLLLSSDRFVHDRTLKSDEIELKPVVPAHKVNTAARAF